MAERAVAAHARGQSDLICDRVHGRIEHLCGLDILQGVADRAQHVHRRGPVHVERQVEVPLREVLHDLGGLRLRAGLA